MQQCQGEGRGASYVDCIIGLHLEHLYVDAKWNGGVKSLSALPSTALHSSSSHHAATPKAVSHAIADTSPCTEPNT